MCELDDSLDPKRYLDQLIVDNTCEWCGNTLLPFKVYEHGQIARYTPRVIRTWMARVEQKKGYRLEHRRVWRVCDKCRSSWQFDKYIFPVIKGLETQQDLISQLVTIQPMGVPAGEILYMDYVRGPARPGPRREEHDLPESPDAVAGKILAYTAAELARDTVVPPGSWKAFVETMPRRGVRGQRADAVMLDDANWRLDPNHEDPRP